MLAAEYSKLRREKREQNKMIRKRTGEMVLTLMEYGEETLKATVTFPKWSAEDLIRMAQMNIPIRQQMKRMDRKPTVTIQRIRRKP